jgi:hypothetical protein
MNIRVNARDRTNAWLQQSGATYPLITSPNTATATSGQPFSYETATINAPATFAASGLPDGLTINASTGRISGTPARPGTYAVQVVASNPAGSTAGELWLTVH